MIPHNLRIIAGPVRCDNLPWLRSPVFQRAGLTDGGEKDRLEGKSTGSKEPVCAIVGYATVVAGLRWQKLTAKKQEGEKRWVC
jgi:hypothetical protein